MNTATRFRVSAMLGVAYRSLVAQNVPTASYRLDETSGTAVVDSVGGASGTYTGTPTLAAASIVSGGGTAAVFNGSTQYATVASSAAVRPGVPITLLAWCKPNSIGTDQTVLRKDLDYFVKIDVAGTWQIGFWNSTGGLVNASSSAVAVAGHVYMVAARWDGTTISLYVGDATAGTFSQAISFSGTAGVFGTGTNGLGIAAYGAGNEKFAGTIDEVAIFNSVLSPSALQGLFDSGRGVGGGGGGGGGTVLWDSAYNGGGGGYLGTGLVPDSSPNANENVIQIVDDPLGVQLNGVTRKVAKIASDETVLDTTYASTGGSVVRSQAGSPNVIPVDTSQLIYIAGGYLFPSSDATVPGTFPAPSTTGFTDWGDVHGPPYSGSPILSWALSGGTTPGVDGVGRTVSGHFQLRDGYNSVVLWNGPDVTTAGFRDVWIDVVVEILYKTTATGSLRVWMNTGSGFALQTLTNGSTQISNRITCGPGDSQGDNYFKIAHYYALGTFSGATVTTYFAETKIGTSFAAVAPHSYG